MTHSPPRLLRFQLIFFVPVAVVVAVAGLLNLGSLQSLRQTQRAASVQQADDMYRVGVATRFNQEIASIQRRVTSTLEQAGKGRLDESDVYRVHSEVVNRLARLAEDLPVLQSAAGAGAVEGGVQADFDAYRNLIVSATDLAAIDPKGAMRQAYQAASSYVALSEHTHAIATAVSAGAAARGENQAQFLERHAIRIAMVGGLMVTALIAGWFLYVFWMTRRLNGIASALKSLADGEVDPPSLPLVEAIGRNPRSVLRSLAQAVLAFHRTAQAREEAQGALRKLSLVVEQTPTSVVVTDLAGRIEYVNDAFVQQSGYARSEVIGSNPRILKSGKTPPETYQAMWADLTAGHNWRGELVNRTRSGEERIEAVSITPLRQPDGNITHYVAIKDDITEQKRIGEELTRHRDHLEQLVTERNAEVIVAMQAAEAASRSKSEFLANMSHEIRTPMNAIIGLTHLLSREIDDARHADRLAKIGAAAHHLLNLINDILDLSKIEAGKLELEFTDFEVERVVGNVIALIRDKAEAKQIELVVDMRGIPAMLHGDGLRLQQILLNFAGNAVKFTASGSIALRAEVVQAEDTKLRVRFEVCDSGIGLTPEQQGELFQSFRQADTSITRKFGGTGLGLAISRRLVELMGGRIGVDSSIGNGSTFWIEVPFSRCSADARPPKFEVDTRGLRALVVDDLPEARESLVAMLTRLLMAVDSVADGGAALERVAEADATGLPYDLLLVDWQMPGLDGLEVGRRLLAMPLSRSPASLLVTSYPEALPPNALSFAGYFDVLAKPVSPSQLLEVVQNTLSGRHRAGLRRVVGEAEAALRQRGGARVLLVEDNAINQEVACDLLTDVGIEVDVAEDGQVAVDKARETAYELILMDVQMPVVDGLAATRLIRAMPRHATTPILAMTANAFEEDRRRCHEAGMNDHVAKPVEPEALYRSLLNWLPARAPAPQSGVGRAVAIESSVPAAEAPDAAGEAALRIQLDLIDGLNVAAGLTVTRGRMAAYARLLRQFADNDLPARLRAALAEADIATARRVAHTLKGTAGTVGARKLMSAAAALEAELADTGPAAPEALMAQAQALQASYDALCRALRLVLPAEAAPASLPAGQATDWLRVREVAAQLEAALLDYDLNSAAIYTRHAALLNTALGARAATFSRQIEDFDFDQAVQILHAAMSDWPAPN